MPVKTKWQQPLKRNAPKMKCQKLQVYTSNHLKLQILNMIHTIATETTIFTLAIKTTVYKNPNAIDIPVPLSLAANDSCSCRSCSCLPTSTSSSVPPSQTLGVLFFPLSPPSRKGDTHNQRVSSSSARLKG
jgi:hypothetical protein